MALVFVTIRDQQGNELEKFSIEADYTNINSDPDQQRRWLAVAIREAAAECADTGEANSA